MGEKSLCSGVALHGGAFCVDAAFGDQEFDQAVHRRIIGAADQCRHLTFLADQARQDQAMQMMGERRSRDVEFFLQVADRQPVIAGPHERAIDLEPGRIAERFELFRCFFDFHGNITIRGVLGRQVKFRRWSKLARITCIAQFQQRPEKYAVDLEPGAGSECQALRAALPLVRN